MLFEIVQNSFARGEENVLRHRTAHIFPQEMLSAFHVFFRVMISVLTLYTEPHNVHSKKKAISFLACPLFTQYCTTKYNFYNPHMKFKH